MQTVEMPKNNDSSQDEEKSDIVFSIEDFLKDYSDIEDLDERFSFVFRKLVEDKRNLMSVLKFLRNIPEGFDAAYHLTADLVKSLGFFFEPTF